MTKAVQLKNGQPAGAILVGAGKVITVVGIAADGVTGKLGGGTVKVAVDRTDLLQRADPSAAGMEPAPSAPEAPTEAPASAPSNGMQRRLSGKLVQLSGNMLSPVSEAR